MASQMAEAFEARLTATSGSNYVYSGLWMPLIALMKQATLPSLRPS